MKIITTTTKLNPLHPDFDQQLSGLATSIVNGLGQLPISNGLTTAYEVPNEFLNLDTADLLHSKGVEITGFPLWIEIDSKDDYCVFGGVAEEDSLTWEEWKKDNHTFYEVDDKIFIGTNAHTNEDMNWADLQGVREKLVTADMLPVNEE